MKFHLDNFQLNIEFFLTILGFQGRIFPNMHIIFLGHVVKKKKLGFSQLLGGGVRTEVVKIHNFPLGTKSDS